MLKSAANKVMWVGRATVFLVGLAVILALIFGVASMALGANGDFFKVGKSNVASAVSTLTKRGAGPALSLRVGRGAPLAVNSDSRVANLNADNLDGKDSGTYLPGDLPSATTVRGSFYLMNHASASGQFFGEGLSFGYRLPSAPVGHYIKKGQAVPAGCFGNADNPEAQPGHLCLFERASSNVSSTVRGVDSLSRSGGGVYMNSAGAGHTYVIGTWAVTAP
jgi:hypothetical protein